MYDPSIVMAPDDQKALTNILRRINVTILDSQGFHISVPINEKLYADVHITVVEAGPY